MTSTAAKVSLIEFRPDDDWQHIVIADQEECRRCPDKNCLRVCPAGVFAWDNHPGHPVLVRYKQCVECGACRLACPQGAIEFSYPRGGYGVVFHQG
ncbi:ferredoxin family protein [Anaeroselena agilis]|uniref:4Fe-4S dicluster domain-containing protein n=1 Tax=Anaeroselena agilis TaxID=3063788 RepID=A0ABU3NXE9_9FIRM|nr:4Fe-4S dicluster domain-containing protein [Selenomonadales bacterium 4137-cl]